MKLLKIIFVLISLKNACSQFSNIVEYPRKSDDNIYRFYLEVSEGLSMAYWNSTRETYQVVVKQNGSFYLRDRRSSTTCGAVSLLDPGLAQTVVKAAGLHKEMLMVNRMFPGTPIVVPVNSTVRVKVKNMMMTDTLAIHWHGLSQYSTFFMDGVSRVTQCPIGPGDSFTYEFQVTELGTHWYHAHSGEQRMDGVYGPLIVTSTYNDGSIVNGNTSPPTKYEKEFYFHVQEWFQNKASSIVQTIIWEDLKYLYGFDDMTECLESTYTDDGTPSIMFPFIRETDAIVINGKGSYKVMTQVNKTYQVDSILASQAFNLDLEVFTVDPNRQYLFRSIGANAGQPLEIRIGGHKLHVVASDGNPIKPIEVDSLIINGGERYDFYINTKGNDNQMNYFITVKTLETKNENFSEIEEDNFGLAILKYSNVNSTNITCGDACQACNATNNCTKLNCPFWPNRTDGLYRCITVNQMRSANIPDADTDLLQTGNYYTSDNFEEHFFNFHFSGSSSLRSSISGKRFVMPSIPLYFKKNTESLLTSCAPSCFAADNQTCECTHIEKIGTNKVVQFVFYNMGSGAGPEGNPHPVHLHGHHFYVIHVGYPTYYASNYSYAKSNQDLTCFSDNQVCSMSTWRNSSWAMGNLPSTVGVNLVDPPLKDTMFVPVGGYAVVRFRSNNTGYWLLHCHIDVHHAEGMVVLIQEGSSDQIANTVDYSKVNFCSSQLDRVPSLNLG